MTRWGPAPPRWLVWLAVAVSVVGAVLTVAGAVRIGVTVDETFHVVRLRSFLDHGWYLLDDDLAGGVPGSWVGDAYVYAPATTVALHLLNVLAGNEGWDSVSTTSSAYVVRHLGIAAMGLATAAAVALMARLLSGSWRWGVVAAASLVALPVWSGHAMFNVKDVPVAAGYTAVTLALMLLTAGGRADLVRRAAAMALLGCGTLLAIGTRPGVWPGPAAACAVVVLLSLVGDRGWWRVRDVVLAVAAAALCLLALYPAVFLHPGSWLMGAAQESAGYNGTTTWRYIPINVVCTVPLVLLALGATGSARRLRVRWSERRARPWTSSDQLMLLVVLQALLLPCLVMVAAPALNGGLRHVLFAAPAVAVLVAAAIAALLQARTSGAGRRSVAAIAGLGLVLPTVAQVQLFPLAYAYANPFADALGVAGPADYWQASLRELADDLPPGRAVLCGWRQDEEGPTLRRIPAGGQSLLVLGDDCATNGALSVLQPWLGDRPDGEAAGEGDRVEPDFVALVVAGSTPAQCREIARVTRHRLLATVVESRALLCPLALPDYVGPVRLDGAGLGSDHLLGGWSGTGGDSAVTVTRRASLGFALPGGARGIRIHVVGEADADLEFAVNNSPADVSRTADGWLVQAPRDVGAVGSVENVVLTVIAPHGEGRIREVAVEGGD